MSRIEPIPWTYIEDQDLFCPLFLFNFTDTSVGAPPVSNPMPRINKKTCFRSSAEENEGLPVFFWVSVKLS